jgi:hypothetical protein
MRTAKTMVVVGSLVLGGLGCGTTPPEPMGQRQATVVDDLDVRAPSRGKVRGGERMRRTVAWPAEALRDLDAYAGFDPRSRTAIDAAPVPVLVPGPEVALDQREVLQGPEWYAFWGRREGAATVAVTITLHASGMARVYPGVRPQPGPQTLRGQPAFVSRNEGIWSASWIEHGVAYDLGLECAPVDAPPCHDEAELEALVEGLRYVGGRQATKDREVVQ